MDEKYLRDQLHHAAETRLSGLTPDPWLAQRVLENVKGEEKVKKKLSVGFVLVIVLVLVVATALAAALLWEQQVIPMKEIEQTEGDYANWPLSQKQVLIRALIDSGNIEESDETEQLFGDATDEAKKIAIADQLVKTLTGETDVKEISVDIITYALMGFYDTWTPEQRVWWQQVTDRFHGNQGAPDTLITPTEDVISEVEAIAIAKEAIIAAWGESSDVLDKALIVANLYVTEQRPDYRRWDVQFKILKEGSDSYVERIRVAIVDEHGQVIDDPDVGITTPQARADRPALLQSGYPDTPLFQLIDDFITRANRKVFELWSLELKAEYSQVVAPQVRTIVENGDLTPLDNGKEPDLDVMAFSSYTYGLPGSQDIPQEEAFTLAKQAIMDTYQLNSETVSLYDNSHFYFDISNLDKPLWKIVFWPKSSSASKFPEGFVSGQGLLRYKVEINSQTGEIVKIEEFEFQVYGGDLDYKLKLY